DRETLEGIADRLEDPVADLVRKDSLFKKLGLDPAGYVERHPRVAALVQRPARRLARGPRGRAARAAPGAAPATGRRARRARDRGPSEGAHPGAPGGLIPAARGALRFRHPQLTRGRMTADNEKLSIDTIRCLAMDAVQKANAGHPGTAMALAPV